VKDALKKKKKKGVGMSTGNPSSNKSETRLASKKREGGGKAKGGSYPVISGKTMIVPD